MTFLLIKKQKQVNLKWSLWEASEMLTQIYSFINFYSGKFLREKQMIHLTGNYKLHFPSYQTEFPITS